MIVCCIICSGCPRQTSPQGDNLSRSRYFCQDLLLYTISQVNISINIDEVVSQVKFTYTTEQILNTMRPLESKELNLAQ